MKSILQSIKPQYCESIASGKKTIEVRKTKPKLQTPFKVYIYCTKEELLTKSHNNGNIYLSKNRYKSALEKAGNVTFSGKVIGEYVCYDITKYTTEFHPSDKLFQGIWEQIIDEESGDEYDEIVTGNDFDNPDNCDICKRSCLSFEDIRNYIGYGDRKFYAWHISDLKMYDKPKELSEFKHLCAGDCDNCDYSFLEDGGYFYSEPKLQCDNTINHPPQSWCYVVNGGKIKC